MLCLNVCISNCVHACTEVPGWRMISWDFNLILKWYQRKHRYFLMDYIAWIHFSAHYLRGTHTTALNVIMLCNKMSYQTTANAWNVLMVGLVLLKVTLNCWILLVFMGNPRTPNISTYLITRAKCCLCVSASRSSACEVFNSRFSWQSLFPCCAQHLSKLQLLKVVEVPYCCGPCFMVQNVLT